ncbi:MAG: hypothetical protein NT167_21760, partial [Verrucomicrobia bacterium]|nr:hypothetical protein [Verrucomicrobiota bacterium]
MKARLIKETRDLLPFFAGALLLIVAPFFIWHNGVYSIGSFAFGLACAVLGGCSFGNELHYGTLSLLLSQPIARSVLWREKMLVLGAGIVLLMAALVVLVRLSCPWQRVELVLLAVVALCASCGAPYWTLILKHEIGGMVFAVAVPACLWLGNVLVVARLDNGPAVAGYSGAALLLLYSALMIRLGYQRFLRLQVVEGGSRELALPDGLEAALVRPLGRVSARVRGQFASLLRKEFRLQQISFVLAGLFLLIAVAGACVVSFGSRWGRTILGGDYAIYLVILPLIAGVVSVAEEKGWDLAEWHLTLPPSALKQWSAKMLAVLSTSLVLGLLLPAVMFFAGDVLLARGGARASLPPALQILCWVLGQLLLTSVAVYAASFCNSTIRAILAACAIIALGGVTGAIVAEYGDYVLRSDPMQFRP